MSDFTRLLEAEIPRLRRYARALTRDAVCADDLVQDCLARALAKQHLWQCGTDLRAWLFTILHNQHCNEVRRSVREGSSVELDQAPPISVRSNAIAALELRDLERAINRLPEDQRTVGNLLGEVGAGEDRHGPVADEGRKTLAAFWIEPLDEAQDRRIPADMSERLAKRARRDGRAARRGH